MPLFVVFDLSVLFAHAYNCLNTFELIICYNNDDDDLLLYVPFKFIWMILRRRKVDKDRLYAMIL